MGEQEAARDDIFAREDDDDDEGAAPAFRSLLQTRAARRRPTTSALMGSVPVQSPYAEAKHTRTHPRVTEENNALGPKKATQSHVRSVMHSRELSRQLALPPPVGLNIHPFARTQTEATVRAAVSRSS